MLTPWGRPVIGPELEPWLARRPRSRSGAALVHTTRRLWNAVHRARTGNGHRRDASVLNEWLRLKRIADGWHQEGWTGSLVLAPGARLLALEQGLPTDLGTYDTSPWYRVVRLYDRDGSLVVRCLLYERMIREFQAREGAVQILVVGDRETVVEGAEAGAPETLPCVPTADRDALPPAALLSRR